MTTGDGAGRAGGSYARATRRYREARIAAGPALRRRADRRRQRLTIALRVLPVVLVAAVAAAIGCWILAHRDASAQARGEQAVAAARTALVTMLTADPRDPEGYVRSVLAVTTGEQNRRVSSGRAELAAEIAAQSGPSTGHVLDTGLVAEPRADGTVVVLAVVEAGNPALIGASTTAKRVPVVVTMTQVDGRWLVTKAAQA
ncbi:hypothetical protein HUN08_14285 [Gordonia sp. X0973]|uniref:hypothetical protein n=1 Tax=Gordonia sp. X0973 TaxID=2742602 RepID=UPI000F52EA89|nr:hypothetical protein [Gordonia sp. X0973]QKT08233.1 hypothetical protein HUN08_14285 [Gordonia sp. X0973]